jgi:ribokinase
VDLIFRTTRLPRTGETLAGRTFHLGHGGKGANQAVMARRLGAIVTLVGRVGRDVFGENIIRALGEQEIDNRHVSVDDARATGTAAIIVDDLAQNCILVVPGANENLTPAHLQAAAPAIRSASVVLCQLEVPIETTREAFAIARANGVRTILNPAPAAPLPDELLQLTDLCVPNESEAELLTGQPAATLAGAEAAARRLLARGAGKIIVTLGDRGALLVDGATAEYIPAVPVTAVDPSGAGDALIGSLAVFLAEEVPMPEALRRANAVAALSVTRPGTQESFPDRAEVEEFLKGG